MQARLASKFWCLFKILFKASWPSHVLTLTSSLFHQWISRNEKFYSIKSLEGFPLCWTKHHSLTNSPWAHTFIRVAAWIIAEGVARALALDSAWWILSSCRNYQCCLLVEDIPNSITFSEYSVYCIIITISLLINWAQVFLLLLSNNTNRSHIMLTDGETFNSIRFNEIEMFYFYLLYFTLVLWYTKSWKL